MSAGERIALEDIFKPRKGRDPSACRCADNRINRKHVDFLLVRVSDLAPLAGVELDDSSHGRSARQKRDAFVDEVFGSCKLPLLHVPAQANYNVAELRVSVENALLATAGSVTE